MSFKSNVGKSTVPPGPGQCVMINTHHPDCTCASCEMHADVQCLEPYVGSVPDFGDDNRVCGSCAMQAERDDFVVEYRGEARFVIAHPEMGIYLDRQGEVDFWSRLEPAGLSSAVTFATRVQADEVMKAWDGGRPTAAVTWPVVPDVGARSKYASVAACVAAGLEAWDPEARSCT